MVILGDLKFKGLPIAAVDMKCPCVYLRSVLHTRYFHCFCSFWIGVVNYTVAGIFAVYVKVNLLVLAVEPYRLSGRTCEQHYR